MRFPRWFRSGAVSGDVCFVRLSVDTIDGEPFEERPWRLLDNSDSRLRGELTSTVHETLGPEFQVRSVTIGRGSIEIVVLIGTTYYAISRYKNFVESIELMVRQVKEVVKRFFERAAPMHVTVSASWTPGNGLAGLATLQDDAAAERVNPALWYLILSHAAMLAVVLWLLVGRLRP